MPRKGSPITPAQPRPVQLGSGSVARGALTGATKEPGRSWSVLQLAFPTVHRLRHHGGYDPAAFGSSILDQADLLW